MLRLVNKNILSKNLSFLSKFNLIRKLSDDYSIDFQNQAVNFFSIYTYQLKNKAKCSYINGGYSIDFIIRNN